MREWVGGIYKRMFGLGGLHGGMGADASRASQGHILGVGVGGSVLPLLHDVELVTHGTRPNSAMSIIRTGLGRLARLRIQCPISAIEEKRWIFRTLKRAYRRGHIVEARYFRRAGMAFRQTSNDVIPKEGLSGEIPAEYIRRIAKLANKSALHTRDRGWMGRSLDKTNGL